MGCDGVKTIRSGTTTATITAAWQALHRTRSLAVHIGSLPSSDRALDEAYARHPERFSKGRPMVKMPPAEVSINPVPTDADQATIEKGVNFPTLQRVIGNTT